MEGRLHIAHVMRKVSCKNDLSRLVVTLGRREPLHGMVDEMRLEIFEAFPFEVMRPTILRLVELFRVERLQELIGQRALNVQMRFGFREAMKKVSRR